MLAFRRGMSAKQRLTGEGADVIGAANPVPGQWSGLPRLFSLCMF